MFRKNGNFAKTGSWWAVARACRLGDPLERKRQERGAFYLFGDASAGFWSPRHPKRLGDFNDLPAHIDVARRDGCHASWTYRQSRRTTKEIKTVQGKPVLLGNFLNAPSNCGSNPGPVPVPRLREKPTHAVVGLHIVASDVAASDTCPARKIPAIARFYRPNRDFIGNDSGQVEFESGDKGHPFCAF
jgi:hypothetical protein